MAKNFNNSCEYEFKYLILWRIMELLFILWGIAYFFGELINGGK